MLDLTPRTTDDVLIANLRQQLANDGTNADLNTVIARILAGRGVDNTAELHLALGALQPAADLKGLDTAVALLDAAIDRQQQILIVGDFDCDGATSTALMVRVLREMGARVDFLVPDRFKYGYGLTPQIVELGVTRFAPDVIVTVDNGIVSYAGVAAAKARGIEVIITDHHLTTQDAPAADAVVNPNQLGCTFGSKALVGVGVAFYVLGNLAKIRRAAGKPSAQVSRHLDLVALGTVADVGVLDHNNRILVHYGLQAIRAGRCCVGILALLEQAGRHASQLTAQDFGFIIAPRINAAGRMEDMRIGIECLLADDWSTAQRLAHQLDALNRQRRQVEQQMRQQAEDLLAKISQQTHVADNANPAQPTRSLVLYQDDWHQGVIGIVAGRLKEAYHVPAIVFAPADVNAVSDDDAIKGSARSIAGIHIRDMIERIAETQPDLISHFGGHAMAAGLTIPKRNFAAFKAAFDDLMCQLPPETFSETLYSDGQLPAAAFDVGFVQYLQNLTIWGHGFAAPVFDGVFVVQDVRVLKERHIKLWLCPTDSPTTLSLEAIWFNADFGQLPLTQIACGISRVQVLYKLDGNTYNGQHRMQLMIKKIALI